MKRARQPLTLGKRATLVPKVWKFAAALGKIAEGRDA